MGRIEDYGAYLARRADELAAERDPVEAVDYELILTCKECKGTGQRELQVGRYWADFTDLARGWLEGVGSIGDRNARGVDRAALT